MKSKKLIILITMILLYTPIIGQNKYKIENLEIDSIILKEYEYHKRIWILKTIIKDQKIKNSIITKYINKNKSVYILKIRKKYALTIYFKNGDEISIAINGKYFTPSNSSGWYKMKKNLIKYILKNNINESI
ncbi:MAG: hypothetical protein KatS3mg027_2663 [Bacteroidia bacterium]|nr:MAG: hypothetical protein KatS3mg027_2663 [Bacteroidia bacterium]